MSAIEQTSLIRWMYKHPFIFWSALLLLLLVLKWAVFNLATLPETASTTAIHDYAKAGDIESLTRTLQATPLVDSRDNCQWTALMHAAQNGHLEATNLLINSGADVNAVDKGGYSVLTITAIFNNPDILQLLVNSGANINFQDPEMGWTALIWSAKEGHIQNTRVLLAAGADKTIQDHAGKTALSWATERKQSAIIDLLK